MGVLCFGHFDFFFGNKISLKNIVLLRIRII
jgi:hypothetical protein